METRRLRYFIQIVDSGSISRAAAVCGVAQPALSQQLAILERELSAKLIDRSAAGVSLTQAGAVVYDRAKIILAQVDQLAEAVQAENSGLVGPVVVGVTPSMTDCIGLALVERLCAARPELRLQLLEEGPPQLDGLLATGGVDITVGPRRSTGSGFAAERLFNEPLRLIYPPDWPTPDGSDLAALSRLPWVATRRAHSVRQLIEAAFARLGLEYRIVTEIDSPSAVIRTVQRGLAVTALPRAVADQAGRLGQVGVTGFGAEPIQRPIFVCWRTHPAPSPALLHVLQAIRQVSAEVGPTLSDP